MLERGEAEICDTQRLFTSENTTASTVFQKVRLFCLSNAWMCVNAGNGRITLFSFYVNNDVIIQVLIRFTFCTCKHG